MKYNTILDSIGNTPHLRLNRLFSPPSEVWVKLEKTNPGGSIKDRIALAMVEDAEKSGALKPGGLIIEPTSGNTGIGLALVAAVKGYQLILVMPESMSVERRRIISAYGAKLELTAREKGMPGAIARANEMLSEYQNAWIPGQFDNQSNPKVHEEKTAQEILKDFPEGLDCIITGVGTGGHLTGCARLLKREWKNLQVFAVEPEQSPVLSGGKPGPHSLQGIGAGFIPKNCDTSLLDGVITVGKEESFAFTQRAASEEGLFVGTSSGASLAAVAKKIPDLKPGSRILTFSYDTGERYLSVDGLFTI